MFHSITYRILHRTNTSIQLKLVIYFLCLYAYRSFIITTVIYTVVITNDRLKYSTYAIYLAIILECVLWDNF